MRILRRLRKGVAEIRSPLQFERAENKPAIVAWTSAAIFAFFFSEWLIHLPGLNVLLGFPVQLVGLLVLPSLGLRYIKVRACFLEGGLLPVHRHGVYGCRTRSRLRTTSATRSTRSSTCYPGCGGSSASQLDVCKSVEV